MLSGAQPQPTAQQRPPKVPKAASLPLQCPCVAVPESKTCLRCQPSAGRRSVGGGTESSSCTLIHPRLQSVMQRAGWEGLGSDTFGTCSERGHGPEPPAHRGVEDCEVKLAMPCSIPWGKATSWAGPRAHVLPRRRAEEEGASGAPSPPVH